jgi:voltage-gated potassium channel Kch
MPKYSKISAQLAIQKNSTITSSSQSKTALACAVALVLYIGLGILFLTNYGSMSYFDALYFVVVTFTTVGFGDIRVEGAGQKLFMSCFVFLGLMLLTSGVKAIHRYWAIKREDFKELMAEFADEREDENSSDENDIEKTMAKTRVKYSIESQIELSKKRATELISNVPTGFSSRNFIDRTISAVEIYDLADSVYKFWVVKMGIPPYAIPIIKEMLVGLCLILVNVAVGTLFYAVVVDDMTVANAIYFTCMTITTIGYGDVVPSNQNSKIFTLFYCIGGTLVTARALASFHNALDWYQDGVRNDAILTAKVDLQTLFAMDVDKNRTIDIEEFLLYRLFEMKLVDPEVVSRLERQFARLDKDEDGVITPADLDVAGLVGMVPKPKPSSAPGSSKNFRRGGVSASARSSIRGSAVIQPMQMAEATALATQNTSSTVVDFTNPSSGSDGRTAVERGRSSSGSNSSRSDASDDMPRTDDMNSSLSASDKKECFSGALKCSRVMREAEDMLEEEEDISEPSSRQAGRR